MKERINELIANGAFSSLSGFSDFLLNNNFYKRYSILKRDRPFPIGDNRYKSTFCFFFYLKGYLMRSFYCEVTGTGVNLENQMIKCYQYPCNDANRAECWEWVDVPL
jgi:hypothetical protein